MQTMQSMRLRRQSARMNLSMPNPTIGNPTIISHPTIPNPTSLQRSVGGRSLLNAATKEDHSKPAGAVPQLVAMPAPNTLKPLQLPSLNIAMTQLNEEEDIDLAGKEREKEVEVWKAGFVTSHLEGQIGADRSKYLELAKKTLNRERTRLELRKGSLKSSVPVIHAKTANGWITHTPRSFAQDQNRAHCSNRHQMKGRANLGKNKVKAVGSRKAQRVVKFRVAKESKKAVNSEFKVVERLKVNVGHFLDSFMKFGNIWTESQLKFHSDFKKDLFKKLRFFFNIILVKYMIYVKGIKGAKSVRWCLEKLKLFHNCNGIVDNVEEALNVQLAFTRKGVVIRDLERNEKEEKESSEDEVLLEAESEDEKEEKEGYNHGFDDFDVKIVDFGKAERVDIGNRDLRFMGGRNVGNKHFLPRNKLLVPRKTEPKPKPKPKNQRKRKLEQSFLAKRYGMPGCKEGSYNLDDRFDHEGDDEGLQIGVLSGPRRGPVFKHREFGGISGLEFEQKPKRRKFTCSGCGEGPSHQELGIGRFDCHGMEHAAVGRARSTFDFGDEGQVEGKYSGLEEEVYGVDVSNITAMFYLM